MFKGYVEKRSLFLNAENHKKALTIGVQYAIIKTVKEEKQIQGGMGNDNRRNQKYH